MGKEHAILQKETMPLYKKKEWKSNFSTRNLFMLNTTEMYYKVLPS